MFSYMKSSLIRLISKFMLSKHGKEIIPIHILPNTSRSKRNQTIKFGHLIKYSMITIFLQKSFTNCGGETISRPFSKKSKLSINGLKLYTVGFYLMPS